MLDHREPSHTVSDTRTIKKSEGASHLPMANSFGSQQDRVVQIIVCGGTIAKSLPSMEEERDIKTQLFLTVHKAEEWDQVVYERFRCIFWTDKVKS